MAAGRQAQKRVADVGDRGIGPQALEVALGQAREGAPEHRDHRDADHHLAPLVDGAGEGVHQGPRDQHHACQLGRGGEEGHDRGRGAFVDVGRPHVEGRGGDLEGQAAKQEHQAEQDPGVGAGVHRSGDVGEVCRAGEAVDQRGAVEQQARGQRPQHEILQAGLGGLGVVAAQGGQDVLGQGLQLDADVERDQIARGDHHAHADRRQHDQDRELELGIIARRQPPVAQQHPHRAHGVDGRAAEGGGIVGDEAAGEGGPMRADRRHIGRHQQGHASQAGDRGRGLRAADGADQQQRHRGDGEQDLRCGQAKYAVQHLPRLRSPRDRRQRAPRTRRW